MPLSTGSTSEIDMYLESKVIVVCLNRFRVEDHSIVVRGKGQVAEEETRRFNSVRYKQQQQPNE